jgi:hypothetical protein
VSGPEFPIQKDRVVAKLQESGVMDKIIELVENYSGDKFDNPEQILGLVKGLLPKKDQIPL